MTNKNGTKGAATERMVAKYLRECGWWMADRRLREGRMDDQGDIDGVPFTTIQVKYVESNRYQQWVTDTLRQRDTAGTPYCLLIRRVPQKPPAQWEACMPGHQISGTGPSRDLEGEAWTWLRMELRAAVEHLRMLVSAQTLFHSDPSLSTTSPSKGSSSAAPTGDAAPADARSTRSTGPASPTT